MHVCICAYVFISICAHMGAVNVRVYTQIFYIFNASNGPVPSSQK